MPKRLWTPVAAPSAEALFRYRLVSELQARIAQGQERAEAVGELAAEHHLDFAGQRRQPSERTLYRWLSCFEQQGYDGLLPKARQRIERSVVLPEPFIEYLVEQKNKDERASLPELIRRAREAGKLRAGEQVDRTTVYRACKRMGLYVGRRKKRPPERDTRRFAYAHRMEMVLCDGKYFRAGVTRARRVALFFLDDASRYGLHVVVGTSENAPLFLRGLYETCRRYGFALIYYLDKGPGFIAEDVYEVVRQLDGALLIHGATAYPEGHGKIEKFNQTAKHDVLRGYDARPDVDSEPRALELRLQHYLREQYNHRPHESLGGRSPSERFHSDPRPLRWPDSDDELRRRFVVHLQRTVSNDHVVSVDSVDYEVPTGHAGERVIVHRRLLDGTLATLHEGKLVELHPVDLEANARSPRAAGHQRADETLPPLPKSAADLAFERDLGPVVDADGGFRDPDPQEET